MASAFIAVTDLMPSAALEGVAWGTVVAHILFGLYFTWDSPPAPPGKNEVPALQLAARGVVAALCIFLSVLTGSLNPGLGALLATLPAIFLTAMVSLYASQGRDTTVGAVGPMILGSVSVGLFALCFSYLSLASPTSTAGGDAAITWIAVLVLFCTPVAFWLRWRRGVSEAARGDEIGEAWRPGRQRQKQDVDSSWLHLHLVCFASTSHPSTPLPLPLLLSHLYLSPLPAGGGDDEREDQELVGAGGAEISPGLVSLSIASEVEKEKGMEGETLVGAGLDEVSLGN